MNHNQKDFLEFLSSSEVPPPLLSLAIKKDILFRLKKRKLLAKFMLFQLFGGFLSLALCPQFGLGFWGGHGISHYFRLLGDGACAFFCGAIFLLAANLLAFTVMDADEIYWIWKRYGFRLIVLPSFFWGLLMFLNRSLGLPAESQEFHLIWILSAVIFQQFYFKYKNRTYSGAFLGRLEHH